MESIPVETMSKQQIVSMFGRSSTDTGASAVQVALLTRRIKILNVHFKVARQDHHSRRGLLKMVSQRRHLLSFLKIQSKSDYNELLEKLGLRK